LQSGAGRESRCRDVCLVKKNRANTVIEKIRGCCRAYFTIDVGSHVEGVLPRDPVRERNLCAQALFRAERCKDPRGSTSRKRFKITSISCDSISFEPAGRPRVGIARLVREK
jgi:hypothetical protein